MSPAPNLRAWSTWLTRQIPSNEDGEIVAELVLAVVGVLFAVGAVAVGFHAAHISVSHYRSLVAVLWSLPGTVSRCLVRGEATDHHSRLLHPTDRRLGDWH